MDPIAHTLVGASLARTGLQERTRFGAATLLIGANLPDIDVAAYLWGGETAVWFRRGLTHGVGALVVLPMLLAALVVAAAAVERRFREPTDRDVRPLWVYLLSALAVATHPLLDLLNVYGIRLLMPFSDRWFYGDALFIVDPWLWAVLAVGIWLRRYGRKGPVGALGIAMLYVLAMTASGGYSRAVVRKTLAATGVQARRIMVAPRPLTPFERWVVVEDTAGYQVGTLRWGPRPEIRFERLPYDTEPIEPEARLALRDPKTRRFLAWARFPYYVVERDREEAVVFIGDARYSVRPEATWAATRVTLPFSTR